MAAIRSFDEPIVLMLGGKDKDLPWEDLADLVRERVDHVVVFGQAAEKILSALGTQIPVRSDRTVSSVVMVCKKQSVRQRK